MRSNCLHGAIRTIIVLEKAIANKSCIFTEFSKKEW